MILQKLTQAEFTQMATLVYDRTGIYLAQSKLSLLSNRLRKRMRALKLDGFTDYYDLLRDPKRCADELPNFLSAVTTNETYFFRERRQLNALVGEIIPEQLARKRHGGFRGPVNIWSAGCSSGEEPLSIVMLALEANLRPGEDFRVYASDISQMVLRKSRKGVYREASFRETEPYLREKYFQDKDGESQISEAVRKEIDFVQINLMDRSRVSLLTTMDTIMCRNVIIYFDLDTKKKVMETFNEKLVPGGYLLLGHSESLISITNAFEFCQLKEDLVYRRPGLGCEVADSWQTLAEAAISDTDGGEGIS